MLLSHDILILKDYACYLRVITFCFITFCIKKVITFCVEKLLHYTLIYTLLHFASMLLHFALVLHFAAIVITFCVSITFCSVTSVLPDAVQEERDQNLWHHLVHHHYLG